MAEEITRCLFGLCLSLILYSYVGYPLAIYVAARRRRASSTKASVKQSGEARRRWPYVSLIIAAHNEEQVIQRRIRNALQLDYPRDRLEILVVSDGSTDRTQEIVAAHASRGVRLLDLPQRRGKLYALTQAVAVARGEVLVLSDASTEFDELAVRQLARHFREPDVGVVCGRLILHDPATGNNVDSAYWKYETWIKRNEARLGALIGASGAIYAIRRRMFIAPPPHLVIDDFVIPVLARLNFQCRTAYEEQAIARQSTPANLRSEFARRARIGAGGFQSIRVLWRLLHPRHGWAATAYLSHKILRWLCPFFLLGLILANAALLSEPMFRWLWWLQCAFYLLAAAGLFLRGQWQGMRVIRLTTMFSMMNLALLLGFWRWIFGIQKGVWQRTVR